MKQAIATSVALDEKRRRLTREALADVKAGRTHGAKNVLEAIRAY